jgi:hypothetical protein
VHLDQQRRLGRDLPPEDSTAGQTLEREARSAEILVGDAHRSNASPRSALPLAGPGASNARTGAAPVTAAGGEVHRAADTVMALARPRHAESAAGPRSRPGSGHDHAVMDPTSLPVDLDVTAPQRRDDSTSPVTAIGNARSAESDADIEDLARKIYERIRYRMGRELLLDRERAGVLTDLR